MKARVNKIIVEGIKKTKDDFIQKKLESIFTASTVEEVRRSN